MLINFLIFDEFHDYLQMNFMPIEDKVYLKNIRNALGSIEHPTQYFESNIFKVIKKFLKNTVYLSNIDLFAIYNLDEKQFKITHQMLINAGIDQKWFLSAIPDDQKNTIYLEQSILKSLK